METIKTQSGDDYFILGGQYYILMKCLPGKHIENIYESDYIRIAQVSGEIIGRLHLALLKCQSRLECYENDLGNEINGWVSRYFVDNGYSYISRAEVEQLCSEILIVSRDLPRQLIHRDIHFGNLLFEEETITGYIDFDLSQVNIRIFDICYFSLGLLVEAFKDDSKSEKWFIMLESILAGYDKVNSLQRQERKAAVCVMQCIELLFVAFFAQNGNSELAQGAADMYRWVEKNQEKIRNIFY